MVKTLQIKSQGLLKHSIIKYILKQKKIPVKDMKHKENEWSPEKGITDRDLTQKEKNEWSPEKGYQQEI